MQNLVTLKNIWPYVNSFYVTVEDNNTIYKTGLILQYPGLEVMFEIYNIPRDVWNFLVLAPFSDSQGLVS